jgi:hypothetical protein
MLLTRSSERLRLYFNRHGAEPLVWCIATDSWEIAVSSVHIVDVPVTSMYRPKQTADEDDGKPSAWFEVQGILTIRGSDAEITAP